MPLQFTITTLISDRLAGVSQFFYCNSLFIGGHQVPVAPQVPLHGVDHEPAKIRRLGGLLLSCYVRAMVLPLCVTTLCIAIAFCIWVHEMRIEASSAERDSLLLCLSVHGTSTLCRQLVAKFSGITEWYKSGTTISQNPYAAGFTDQKLYVRQIGINGIMVGYCVLLKFQFACKSSCETLQIALHIAPKLTILG